VQVGLAQVAKRQDTGGRPDPPVDPANDSKLLDGSASAVDWPPPATNVSAKSANDSGSPGPRAKTSTSSRLNPCLGAEIGTSPELDAEIDPSPDQIPDWWNPAPRPSTVSSSPNHRPTQLPPWDTPPDNPTGAAPTRCTRLWMIAGRKFKLRY